MPLIQKRTKERETHRMATKKQQSGHGRPARPAAKPASSGSHQRRPEAQRATPSTRGKKRRGHKTLYVISILMMAAAVATVLSCTVLFDLRTITVQGNTRYTAEQVISASGIVTGVNLVRLNTRRAAKAIETTLPYAETVTVSKKFPFDLVIKVMEPTMQAAVQGEGDYTIISGSGKVLGTAPTAESMPVFEGLLIIQGENGQTVSDPEMLARLFAIHQAITEQGLEGVTMIRSLSATESAFVYQSRVTVYLGSTEELAYKLRFAVYLLQNKIRPDEYGKLNASDPGKGSFNPDDVTSAASSADSAATGSAASDSSNASTAASSATSGKPSSSNAASSLASSGSSAASSVSSKPVSSALSSAVESQRQ